MVSTLILRLDKAVGITAETDRQRDLIVEKMVAITPRMPWLYLILMVNLAGLLFSLNQQLTMFTWSAVAILFILLGRLLHWRRLARSRPTLEIARTELRRVFVLGFVVCVAYCAWVLVMYLQAPDEDRAHFVLFGSIAALCSAFAMSPLPSAARLPLYMMSLPMAGLLLFSGDLPHAAMGVTLLTLIYVAKKLIDVHHLTLTRLVYSRLDVELAKRRAEHAERSAVEERATARKLADTDFLTGLANRRAFLAAIERHAQVDGGPLAVALVDLDGFKPINDTFGHVTGDVLLVEISRRLRAVADPAGLVARLGGDEFAILLPGWSQVDAARLVAGAIEQIARPYAHQGRNLIVSACAGITWSSAATGDATQTIRTADMALFTAKHRGRGQFEIFSESMARGACRRAEIELALSAPEVEQQIEVAFQPIVELGAMKVRAFEALARWQHSDLGWISPAEFIPITEQISMVQQITEALLRRAAAEAVQWPDAMRLSFNLSAVHLCSEGSAREIVRLIESEGLQPDNFQIEVTETALLADFDVARRNLAYLRSHGVRLALDDFGAGYASISYLREMQFDAVKLDGTLLTAATGGRGGMPLLKGVLDLCRAVALPCIAEHVESEVQVKMLRDLGCRYGQGYWLSRPMPAEEARKLAHAPGLHSTVYDLPPARLAS